ncbi:MAG: hypothetical protein EBX67_11350 [Betaproteobacteria bacterium]|nr:hypothetical protein [Betaproteobacteria bacterium]
MTQTLPWSIDLTRIDGQVEPLSNFQGKVLLIVNLASQCGFTPQYAGLAAFSRASCSGAGDFCDLGSRSRSARVA